MGVLEGIVIAAIVLTGAYVGYHAWQESLDTPSEAHSIDMHAHASLQHAMNFHEFIPVKTI